MLLLRYFAADRDTHDSRTPIMFSLRCAFAMMPLFTRDYCHGAASMLLMITFSRALSPRVMLIRYDSVYRRAMPLRRTLISPLRLDAAYAGDYFAPLLPAAVFSRCAIMMRRHVAPPALTRRYEASRSRAICIIFAS